MNDDRDSVEHSGNDAWIFLSIADTSGAKPEFTNPLSEVIANADFRGHAIPSARVLQHAVRDLSEAGWIRTDGLRLELTDAGRELWRGIQAVGSAYAQLDAARDKMTVTRCVASEGGWTLDQRSWEGACATYSAQFALELRRKRAREGQGA